MFDKIFSHLRTPLGSAGSLTTRTVVRVGKISVVAPHGWKQVRATAEEAVLRAPTGIMQATITAMEMSPDGSAEAFQRACEVRYESERRALADGFIKPESPRRVETSSMCGMSYFGADRSTGRMFMGYLKLADGQLTTIYVEGFNVARKDFADCFQSLTECL